jgi:hypothetical protein
VDDLLQKKITPPYIPNIDVNADYDLSFFDSRLTGQSEVQESVLDPQALKSIKRN